MGVWVLIMTAVPVGWALEPTPFQDYMFERVMDQVHEGLIHVKPNRTRLPSITLPTIEHHGLPTPYPHSNPNPSIELVNLHVRPTLIASDGTFRLETRILNGHAKKEIHSTLCSGDDRCSLSRFELNYHFATQYITVTNVDQGLIKYDFENEIEIPLTTKDIQSLNCILRHELYKDDSYLWNYQGMQKYDDDSPMVDGTTAATRLQKGNLECEVPDGALWTTLTVYAHAYAFKNQVQSQSLDDWVENVHPQLQKSWIDHWAQTH